jgi:hypothetical protein
VCLVIEIEAVVDQFVEIDLGRTLEAPLASIAAWTAVTTSVTGAIARSAGAITTTAAAPSRRSILAVPVSLLSSLLFSHVG